MRKLLLPLFLAVLSANSLGCASSTARAPATSRSAGDTFTYHHAQFVRGFPAWWDGTYPKAAAPGFLAGSISSLLDTQAPDEGQPETRTWLSGGEALVDAAAAALPPVPSAADTENVANTIEAASVAGSGLPESE